MADLYGCGSAAAYQLAQGNTTNQTEFVPITGDWLFVANGKATDHKFTLAIKTDGTLWAIGDNNNGQLGLGDTTARTTLTQVGSATNWAKVYAGEKHALAIKTDGTIWAWGINNFGQLGIGSTTQQTNPQQIGSATNWASASAGKEVSFAIKADGTLWAWGSSVEGRHGLGTGSTQTTPAQLGSATWIEVAAFSIHTLAIKTDGTIWAWGNNVYGQLGIGDTNPTAFFTAPQQIGSGTNWASASAGNNHSAAIKTDGTLWACGLNSIYQLAQGDTTTRFTPTQIGSATNWAQVVCSTASTHARNTDGEIWGAGANASGQLGVGNTTAQQTLAESTATFEPASLTAGWGTLFALTADASLPYAVAPLKVTVAAITGSASAPLKVAVSTTGTASAPLRVVVTDSLLTIKWRAKIMLDGNDISARLALAVEVDAEEAAARLAVFHLQPEAGELDLDELLGAKVTIYLVRVWPGWEPSSLMFKGRVERIDYDPANETLRFACQDDLKTLVSNLSIDQIDTLTRNDEGIDYMPGALGPVPADRWDYAQARMACVRGVLDAGNRQNLRVTSFDGTFYGTLNESDIFSGSVNLELPQRSDIINKIDIEFKYRLHRCRERTASIAWASTIFGTDPLAAGYQAPSISAITQALVGLDWHLDHYSYTTGYSYVATSAPSGQTENGDWWHVGTAGAAGNMSAVLAQRHAQPFTELYQSTVLQDASEQTYGTRAQTIRGAVETNWDPAEWERDWSITTPDAVSEDVDYAGTQTREIADETFITLTLMANRIIHASHRTGRVQFAMPCRPEIDLTHNLTVDTSTLTAAGKVARIQHRLDILSGEATSTINIALMGVGAVETGSSTVIGEPFRVTAWGPGVDDLDGWVNDDWELDLPNLTSHVGAVTNADWSESLTGFLVNAPERYTITNFTFGLTLSVENPYYNADYAFPDTGFKIIMPRVAEHYRSAPGLKTVTDERTTYVASASPLTIHIGA
jgi:alpha-tubulin suppressor-like RCC1 family protein